MAYNSPLRLGTVALNVQNLDLQSLFYQQVIGLQVLAADDTTVDLGVPGLDQPIVRLIKTDLPAERTYGLYHIAILHPNRESLAQHFRHLLSNKVPLQGASDHGYSEAIYLADTEGNGIELYQDKPFDTWQIEADGRIIGTTEAMDAEGLLALAQDQEGPYLLPAGTTVGHVHLSVQDAGTSSQLYQKLFGMGDKFSIPTASWIAAGTYHHHLAVNHWAGRHLATRQVQQPGLAYLTIEVLEPAAFVRMVEMAEQAEVTILEQTADQLLLEDALGIRFAIKQI